MSAALRPAQLAHCARAESACKATGAKTMRSQRRSVIVAARFVLMPTGDCSLSHLDPEDASAVSRALDAGVISRSPLELPAGLHEVGREQPAEIVLSVPTVSARHARIAVTDESVCVVDLGSTNGTYVDGSPLEPMAEVGVLPGQEVVFGDQYLAKYKLLVEDE